MTGRSWRLRFLLGILAGMLLLVTAAVGVAGLGKEPRSLAIYPSQTLPLRFFHDRHLKMGMRCELCHTQAVSSTSSADSLLPSHVQCQVCHPLTSPAAATAYPKATCETCHLNYSGTLADLTASTNPPPRAVIPPARLQFSHQAHITRGTECQTCHVGMEGVQLATREQLPTMTTCLSCHDGRRAPATCATCHLSEAGGTLSKNLSPDGILLQPVGRFLPDDHREASFGRNHSMAARVGSQTCSSCHASSFCSQCHEGVQKPGVHPGDWVMRHGAEAVTDGLRCASCHENRSFCQSCHEVASITPDSFPGAANGGSLAFHPPGWADTAVGEDHHGVVARRNPAACAACHADAEATCVQCHGTAVNPHGPGFGESARARDLARAHPETCLACHASGTLELLGGY